MIRPSSSNERQKELTSLRNRKAATAQPSRARAANFSNTRMIYSTRMTPLGKVQTATDLAADPRWQLIERVISSAAFQKSNRLRDLLCHLAERSIGGHASELTEHQIGHAVFGKPIDYSPNEDSSVRVHARQLRLKLHE